MKNLREDIAELFAGFSDASVDEVEESIGQFRAHEAERLREYRKFNPKKNAEYTARWRNKDREAYREYHRAKRWPGTLSAAQLELVVQQLEAGERVPADWILCAMRELRQRRTPTRRDYARAKEADHG